ncbi:MAG TPA: hypothetical protein VKY41_02960 [Xanthomarina sp.]|nr:hypothetical protein [Xanthomarina sp.]
MNKALFILALAAGIFSCSSDSDDSSYTPTPPDPSPTPLVIPEFLPNLSQLNLFTGNLNNLTPSNRTFIYKLNTTLFSDNSYKQRVLALPEGTAMEYMDDGLPSFPNNTVIAKTFYYLNNENNEAEGRQLIETRLLIKKNGLWEMGNYKWNAQQTDAVLDNTTSTVPINYTNTDGNPVNINYVIPSAQNCIDCHRSDTQIVPIGPKLRAVNGNNQLQNWIANNYIANLSSASEVSILPNWEDTTNFTLEERARAYFDINCAHCHSAGGSCGDQSNLRLSYNTPFSNTFILEGKENIDFRMSSYMDGISMPLIGTTMIHTDGYNLISEYLNTL